MRRSIAWFVVLVGASRLTAEAQTQGGGRQINPPPGVLAPLYIQPPSPADSLAPPLQPRLQSPLAPSLPPYPSLQLPPLRRPTSLIEKFFGVGGLRFNYNASVELSAGVLKNRVDNPSLSELARERSSFDFDQKIRLNATAKLGTKLDLLLNYNTESTLGAEGKQVRLSFRGDDKDKLKFAELGNVSLNTRNSLIRSSGSIFGLRTQWQFGKLSLETLIGQSHSTERRVQQNGGREQQTFELSALDYDEGRHFFLGNFFRQRYDEALAQLPYINSPVRITKIELWVTNRRAKYEEAKHLLSTAELGEARPQSSAISASPSPLGLAQNGANNLYALLQSDTRYRDLQQGSRLLAERLRSGLDFEREESARRLSPSEYILNERLGYVSLINRLQAGETLSVAYEYTYEGQTYRVGEFASESTEGADKPLFVKLLKGRTTSPTSSYWSYMMRNVYAVAGLGGGRIGAEQFKLDIAYRNDTEGRMLAYHSTGTLGGKRYLELLGLDQMTAQQTAGQDGRFDYLEGITIQPEQGWVYLPSTEPFGTRLERLGLEEAYRYDALYKQPKEIARQQAERNKYYLRGSYTGHRLGEIQLGRGNLEPGSVVVRSGGQSLTEGVDYSVDYMTGRLQLLSESLLSGAVPVEVSIEGEGAEVEQRRTLLGLDLLYRFNSKLEMGLTAIYQQASSLESKPRYGEHNLSSLELGWRLGWRQELPSLQKLLQKLSLGNKQVPSRISLDLELAHSQDLATAGAEGHYLDDFDTSRSEIDLSSAQAWSLASTPYDRLPSGGTERIESGYDRAHLSWFQIDPMFQRESNRLMPSYIRSNPSYLTSHYVREVDQREIYPHRELEAGSNTSLQTLSLRYYPRERGMYNLGTRRLGADGYLLRPEESWAGVMRRLDLSDFEAANVEYLEFWLMDPNIGETPRRGGDLYFNIGDISEDVLLDGQKAFEHGLPTSGSSEGTSASDWGLVPTREMLGNSFELQAIAHQDVGLDGLSNEGESSWPAYARYLRERSAIVQSEPNEGAHGPRVDPAGDDFEHYRSPRYDEEQSPILERYKYYNGTEGNSREGLREQAMIGRIAPDSEDLNQDKILNEENRYYEYKVSLRPEDLREGHNHIVASRSVEVTLRDGSRSSVRWYQFRIPLSSYTRAIGGISDMRSMRFLRMYLSGFRDETDLRFASLKLMRGDWRVYTEPLHPISVSPTSTASLHLSSVNIEEHADREPISYVLPPGTSRSRERGSASGRERNEQSLAMQIAELAPEDARAIYRHVQYDLRRYERLELSVHAEALAQSLGTAPEDGELELFLRLGSDFRNNYYEYSLPLSLTPQGRYYSASEAHRAIVWPSTNKVELALTQLSALKRRRNKQLAQGSVRLDEAYEEPSELERTHRLGLVGNPSLGAVRTLMIGVRNRSGSARSAEVWLNELHLSEPELDKGWAARAQLGLTLSDWATLNLGGQGATAGFAQGEQMSLGSKREDQMSINLSGQMQLGQLLPDKLGAKIPLTYSYSREAARPEYSPIDEDIKMSDALADAKGETLARLEQYGQRERVQKSLSLMGVQLGIRSKKPMPYDPANLTFNFNHSDTHYRSPELNYQRQLSWLLGLQYEYAPAFAPLRPFAKIKGKSQLSNYLRDYALLLWPSKVSLSSTLQRSYEEEQLRQGLDESEVSRLPATFSNLFVWYRKMSLQWTPLPQLNLSLQTGTDARIEAPLVQVNRELNPDDYALWQEAVDRSIAELGRPQRYTQEASASYTLPTESFKGWRWLGLSTSYNSSYQWDLGSHNSFTGLSLPNTLSNQRSLELSGLFRLKQLFALSPKLAKLEKRIHATGKRDSTNRLSLGDRLLYSLLMLKDLNLSWRESQMIHLPGYLGEVGAIWGQKSYAGALRPGLGFAFGGGDEHFIEQLAEEGHLSLDTQQALSAVLTRTKVFDLKATLQPIKDLNISLQANYTHTRRTELQYMYAGQPRLYGGDMQMTVVGLRGFFEHSTSEGGYSSHTFGRFIEERRQLAEELSSKARGLGASEENSNNPAVLLTAFHRTYLGEGRLSDGAIPNLSSMLPNWTINYSGLGRLKPFSRYFRSISLRHSYRGIYRINSYNSHSSWSPLAGEEALGLIATERSTRLGYMEDIGSLSLTESFFPLIGADMTMLNGLTLSNQWRRSRSLTLSLGSARLIESLSNEWNVSLSYRLSDISRLWKPKPKLSTPASPQNSLGTSPSTPAPKAKSSQKSVSRGLTLKADYSYRYTHNLIRSLARSLSEATLSTRDQRWTFSADYELSRAFTLRAYYELSRITPLVSGGSFSSLETRYGIALKLNLSH